MDDSNDTFIAGIDNDDDENSSEDGVSMDDSNDTFIAGIDNDDDENSSEDGVSMDDSNDTFIAGIDNDDDENSSEDGVSMDDSNDTFVAGIENVQSNANCYTFDSYALMLKARYKDMKYPTLVQSSLPNEYFDLLIVDTKVRSHVCIEDIGKLPDGSQARYILIEGESGVGKTMLLHHIAKQWAAGKILTQYRMVLLHTVFKSRFSYMYYGNLILNQCSDRYTYDMQEHVKNSKGKDICFLIDTYDHLPYNILNAINIKMYFPEATVLFTCRSEWVTLIRESIIRDTEQYLKVIGFTQNGKDAYIRASLSYCLKIEQTFQDWISQHPFGLALTYRPLYCTMLIQLCKAEKLPLSLLNITGLYKQYIFNEISKHTGKAVEGFCDVQEHDMEVMLSASETDELQLSPTQSFGFGKYFNAFGIKDLFFAFVHPSFRDFFQAVYYCSSSKNFDFDYCYYTLSHNTLGFIAGLEKPQTAYDFYSCRKVFAMPGQCNMSFPPNACLLQFELFETKSSHDAKKINELLHKDTGVPLEADPLSWYFFGWCLQNSGSRYSITYDTQELFHTPLCLEMLLNGCNHYTDSPSSDIAIISQIYFNGGSKLDESLYRLSLLKAYFTQVEKFEVCGILDSNQGGLELDQYLPNLKNLHISCQNSFGSQWIPMIRSFPQLVSLSTLHICDTFTDSTETAVISEALSSSIKSCKSLTKLYTENISSSVLDDLFINPLNNQLLSSLTSLYTVGSTCTNQFAKTIRAFVASPKCSLEKVIIERCSIQTIVLGEILESLFNSKVHTICIFGNGSVDNAGAEVIADLITKFEKEEKTIVLYDSDISKLGMEPVIKAVSKSKNITLCIPSKYKFDFHMYETVDFISFRSGFRKYID